MSNSTDAPWPPTTFARGFQKAREQAVEQQLEFARRLFTPQYDAVSQISAMSGGVATFKTRVQSGGRISIPDAEREALDIEEGDIVQAMVVPVENGGGVDE